MSWTLITGASSGIGADFVRVAAKDGYNVVLIARRRDRLEALAHEVESEFGVKTLVVVEDLSCVEAVVRVHDACVEFDVEVLVNNAGLGDNEAFVDSDIVKMQQMIDVNITALTHLTRLFAPDMIKRGGGRIIQVASMAGFVPGPFMSVYYATKAYVLSFSEGIACELRKKGVYVTVLCPGATQTEFIDVADVADVRGFKGSIASSREVAVFGWRESKKKIVIALQGSTNRVLLFAIRFVPRRMIRFISEKFNT